MHIAPSRWDTLMGARKLDLADPHCFLGTNLAAVGQTSEAFREGFKAMQCPRTFTDQKRPDSDILVD